MAVLTQLTMIEAYSQRGVSLDSTGAFNQIDVPYIVLNVTGDDPEKTALEHVSANAPARVNDLARADRPFCEIAEKLNETTYRVTAHYKFDGSSGSMTIYNRDKQTVRVSVGQSSATRYQSIQTKNRYPETAPSYNGLINVDNAGNVNGVEVSTDSITLTVTKSIQPRKINARFWKDIAEMTNKVNSQPFSGFMPGEVLFKGVEGEGDGMKRSDRWTLTYHFGISVNAFDMLVGDNFRVNKRGWDYLWCRYADQKDGAATGKKIVAVYVEQVYEYVDLNALGVNLL
ncbi:hypothetical protein [Oligosphaera ethanolica]|uniref:Uncharacterized protein n=1 Tax=Oligosphaera ethanolica TaxID=760260 RepID=A0AAE4AQE8_9BACT|nr:hypothetical protein [Oligosphaera ethanolica]MDQ0291013.1 hypothetical protein [Oligosphaera ethanolica]